MNFNIELALELSNSSAQFPVDFDKAWQWLGYSAKDKAKRALSTCGFTKDLDYTISFPFSGDLDSWQNPKPQEVIRLTVEAFKSWGMMAGTEQGKQVRLYFLECERRLKSRISVPQMSNTEKAKASCGLLDVIFEGVPLKPELLAGLKINMIERMDPESAYILKEARQLLINNTATEYKLMTVTEIGGLLGISAVATNKKLTAAGLQLKNLKKNSQKDAAYLATAQGLEFSELTLATGKNNTTHQQLRWYDSVVSLIS